MFWSSFCSDFVCSPAFRRVERSSVCRPSKSPEAIFCARGAGRRLEEAGVVQSMSRKGNCIDNGATEQVFGHIKDEFFRGRTWPDFESFKADLDDFVVHWNTRRRQVKLKGLTPEEFRSQSLAA